MVVRSFPMAVLCVLPMVLEMSLRRNEYPSITAAHLFTVIYLCSVNFDNYSFWYLIVTMVYSKASFPLFISSYIIAWQHFLFCQPDIVHSF